MKTFSMTDKEHEAADKWITKHLEKCEIKYDGAIGGRISFIFTPTGLGNCVVIKCRCGKKKNVTDFDEW